MRNRLILSTCGTSILTNTSDAKVRGAIIKASNYKSSSEASADEREIINNRIEVAKLELLETPIKNASSKSAELAGILAYYKNDLSKAKGDIHYLLATDTWLGKETAELTKKWLEQNGLKVEVHRQLDLQTADWTRFSSSLSDLVKWCNETIYGYSKSHDIIFNLSGGFKSETGFLQVLGMFYADETFYIFERSSELVRIPKLPVKMEDIDTVITDLMDIRRASMRLKVTTPKNGIYWVAIDNEYTLTHWGELIFSNLKKEIYSGKVYDSISPRINIEKTFFEDCDKYGKNRFYEINTKIDYLAQMQEHSKSPNFKSLDFKAIAGPKHLDCTHECDAWHDGKAFRMFCTIKNNIINVKYLREPLHKKR